MASISGRLLQGNLLIENLTSDKTRLDTHYSIVQTLLTRTRPLVPIDGWSGR